jgi:hypothetical protein
MLRQPRGPGGGRYSEAYAQHKVRNWLVFLRRHAPLHQKMGFLFISAPFLMIRIIVREGLKGNFGAVRGIFRGVLQLLRPR